MKVHYILFCLFSIFCYSQKIEWSPKTKLNSSDFKGIILNEIDDKAASSMLSIEYKIVSTSIWTGKIKLKISPTFDSSLSWIKPENISENLLNHEQKHFDIAKIFSEKIQSLVNNKIKGTKDFNDSFQKIYDEIYDEYYEFQKKYDAETKHGTDIKAQENYDALISELLKNCNCR